MTKAGKISLLSLTPFQRKKLQYLAEAVKEGYDPRRFTVVIMGRDITFTSDDYKLYQAVFGVDPLALVEITKEVTPHASATVPA